MCETAPASFENLKNATPKLCDDRVSIVQAVGSVYNDPPAREYGVSMASGKWMTLSVENDGIPLVQSEILVYLNR